MYYLQQQSRRVNLEASCIRERGREGERERERDRERERVKREGGDIVNRYKDYNRSSWGSNC